MRRRGGGGLGRGRREGGPALTFRRPESAGALAAWLRSREGVDAPLLATGARGPGSEADRLLRCEGAGVVSTAELGEVVEIRAEDLTATVGAGLRVGELRTALGEAGLWLPPAGLSAGHSAARNPAARNPADKPAADREAEPDAGPTPRRDGPAGRSAGGLVAAAPAGPTDARYGPVRRHLLAARVVTWEGTEARWGRAVMKNVAGYDLPRLLCGSFGRLGVLTEVTFRLWPAPGSRRAWALHPPASDPPEEAPVRLLDEIARGSLEGSVRPDAVVWRLASPDTSGPGTLRIELLGTEASVEAREAALREWIAERGGDLEPLTASATADPGGEEASADAPRPSVVELSFPRRRVARSLGRVREVLAGSGTRIDVFPEAGTVRCSVAREGGAGEDPDGDARGSPLPALLAACPEARVRVLRGTRAELERVEARRPDVVLDLERRVVGALEGRARHWLADHL